MKGVELYVDSESSILSPGGRALAKAAEKMIDNTDLDKLKFETIPSNLLEWRNSSDEDYLKHDLILTTKAGSEYFMGCVIKSRGRFILEEKVSNTGWDIMPKMLRNHVHLVKQKSLKRAKEKLKDCVVRFLEDVQE
jgi:hypothetical protein